MRPSHEPCVPVTVLCKRKGDIAVCATAALHVSSNLLSQGFGEEAGIAVPVPEMSRCHSCLVECKHFWA